MAEEKGYGPQQSAYARTGLGFMGIVREGWPFILGCLGVSGGFALAARLWGIGFFAFASGIFFLAAGFCAYFFRDPARTLPTGQGLILCPADGKVMEVVPGTHEGKAVQIVRIFLSVFDPHLQRTPITGTVKKITYVKGKFLDARDPKAAFENEQNHILIEGEGVSLVVTQIAGLIARRIVCWVNEGQAVKAGDKIGLIRFGSQVDIILPASANVKVKAGDVVTAGDLVLAQI